MRHAAQTLVYLRPADHPVTELEGYSDGAEAVENRPIYVEPQLRPEVVEDFTEDAAPRFQGVPLRLSYSGTGTNADPVPESDNLTGTEVPE